MVIYMPKVKPIDGWTLKELYASFGIKPIPKSARKNPNEDAVQLIRRLRTKVESGKFVW